MVRGLRYQIRPPLIAAAIFGLVVACDGKSMLNCERLSADPELATTLLGEPIARLDQYRLPENARILSENAPITRDFRPDRLNIFYDASKIIITVDCF